MADSDSKTKKDKSNQENGLKKLEKGIKTGKLIHTNFGRPYAKVKKKTAFGDKLFF